MWKIILKNIYFLINIFLEKKTLKNLLVCSREHYRWVERGPSQELEEAQTTPDVESVPQA